MAEAGTKTAVDRTGGDKQTALWDDLLDAELNVRFWEWMSDRYNRFDMLLKAVVGLASSGAVAGWGIWSEYPLGWKVLSGIASLTAVLHPIICSTDKLRRLGSVLHDWKEVRTSYDLLWAQDPELIDAKNWKQYEDTKKRRTRIDETRLPKSERFRKKAYKEVVGVKGNHGRQAETATAAPTT